MIVFKKSNFIILLFLSILLAIKNFEDIPIWNNNQEVSSLPNDLSNSIIESYAISNSTGDILYLINEDNNSYLYINGKRYKNDDLKYFASPLFKYNETYYFCSSLSIIKLSLKGDIESIDNPNELNEYNGDYHLKCFCLPSKNIIVVAFINTPYFEYFDLVKSNWTDLYNNSNKDNIMDANFYDNNHLFLGILTKGESYYKFIPFSNYYDIQIEMVTIKIRTINETLYSKVMISSGINKNDLKIYVFTYEPEEMNKYNYYEFNLWNGLVIKEGNLFLKMFKEAEIYNAFFIENSPVLAYIIRKFDKNGEYNFYLGAVDIESLVILYNIQIDDYKKVFYDNGYLYDNKLFLRYFEKGKQIKICPFIYDLEQNLCQFLLSQSNYYAFNSINGLIENKNNISCNKMNLSHYCVEDCPFGFYRNNNSCELCFEAKTNKFYFYGTKTCTYDNREMDKYPHEGRVYYDCERANLKYFDNNCYKSCSEIYGQINDNSKNECITCESLNKVFSNGKCEDTCEGQDIAIIEIEINKIKYNFCPNCDGKYYYNYRCYDKCPLKRHLNNSINICYFCSQYNPDKKYYQNGICVSECDKGYEALISDKDDNDYYCNYCKDEGKYYKNGKCEDKCSDGYGINQTNNVCEFCASNINGNNSYYNNACLSECPFDDYGWIDDNNICVNCSSRELFLKEKKCVPSCENYIREGYKCLICPNKAVSNKSIYYFEYECLEECPNYTVLDPQENRCKICNSKYQDAKCVEDCSVGYLKNKTIIPNSEIEVEICTQCGLDNNSWYDGINCTNNCPMSKYRAEDHFCRLCFCGFSKIRNCSIYSDKCNCVNDNKEEEIFGNNCEFKRKKAEEYISIIPMGSVISSKKSYFTFNLTDEDNNKNLSIKWAVFVDDSEITDMHNYVTGINEKYLIINYDVFKPDLNNKITLNLIDEKNPDNSYYGELYISIQSLGQQKNVKILDSSDSSNIINTVMNNNIIIKRDNLIGIEPYKFYYKILIKDENNEIIPIKQKKELQPFLDRTNKQLSMVLPFFTQFIFELSNNRGEKYNIYQEIDNQNSFIELSLEEITSINISLENYDEIEKIFLIMKYLDIKNETISDNNYNLLFEFIKDKLINAANENGHYEGKEQTKEESDSIRYYLNYYEPKTIFSLLNKIFLHEGINIPDKYYTKCFYIFKKFFEVLIGNNYNEKLDNSNILSFFRTFDHFLEIYINKEKNEKKNIIDKDLVFELLNNVSEYLVDEIYPGETIRLVGKRVSLFLSHFGKYQNNISFAAINNIAKNIKYDDYNTFSFDDYYLNQKNCDDDGNTLLCINNDNYKKFKSNLEDISLAFFLFNSNGNIAENTNEGNSFKLKFITNDSKYSNASNGTFYDIVFPFNYVSNSNDVKQFTSNDNNNNDRDYSNIACIPKNNLKNEKFYCFTYFNYETNMIKCSCNVIDEITYVSDYETAKYYKDFQYKKMNKNKSYILFNKLSVIIVFILLLWIFLPNIFYLLYDLKNDIKKVNYKLLSLKEKIGQRYSETKILINSSVFSFSIYVFIFKFPILSSIRNCNFNSPKYIKHFINTLSIFYGFIISLAIFNYYIPIKEVKEIIDKRDIHNPNFEVNIHMKYKYLNRSIIFSIFGVCFTRLLIYIFGIILSYNTDDLKYWRELKNIFANYIKNYIKREVLLDTTWKKIKNRMIAYTKMCGIYVINKKETKEKKINKTFDKYLKMSQRTNSENKYQLLPLNELDEEMAELCDNTGKNNLLSSNNKNKNNIGYNRFIVDYSLDKEDSNYKIINEENFQLYSTKIKIDKEVIKNNKFERIKNKYICKKRNRNEFEEDKIFKSNEYNKKYKIVNEYNLSYYPLKDFVLNEIINKRLIKDGNSTFISSINYNPEGFNLLIVINIILFILLFALICIIAATIKAILNNFGSFLIKIWLSTFILIFCLAYPVLYFIKSLIGSTLLFKYYHLKNQYLCKFLYWLFVDKTMIYIFKVRNFISKHKEEIA